MKYSDEQRLSKIIEKTEALLLYIEKNGITEDIISSEEPVQWAITTPLYNIGEHACIKKTSAAPIRNQTPNTSLVTDLSISLVISSMAISDSSFLT